MSYKSNPKDQGNITNNLIPDTQHSTVLDHLDKLFRMPSKWMRDQSKPYRDCLNPNCDNQTNHSKGYCSAECFKGSR